MKTKTNVKAGGKKLSNHNETLRGGLKLKTHVKAGGKKLYNHNETLRGDSSKTRVKAGIIFRRH
jgi:hypothetical protein